MKTNSASASRLATIAALVLAVAACQVPTAIESDSSAADAAHEREAIAAPSQRPQRLKLPLRYPQTATVAQTDNYHGTQVADPYRWLEDDVRENPQVRAWADAQQKLTRRYLDALPEREPFARSLRELWNYERQGVPTKAGGRYFFSFNDGLMNQSQVRVRDRVRDGVRDRDKASVDGSARVLLDPNRWAEDGTTALAGYYPSPDGKYLAYLVQEDGSDWRHARVLDVASGNVLADDLRWLKFTGLSWRADSSGFYYSRYPQPDQGETFQSLNTNHALYWHALGAAQNSDELVFHDPAHPEWGYGGVVSHDGAWLVIQVRIGTDDRNQVVVQDLRDNSAPRFLIQGFEQDYTFIAYLNEAFYFRTDLDAPMGRVVAVHARTGQLREVVPEREAALESAKAVGNRLLLAYLKDASSELQLVDYGGKRVHEVELPALGSTGSYSGRPGEVDTFFSFSSFTYPGEVLQLDLASGQTTTVARAEVAIDSSAYEVQQHFATSADGTRVPFFVVHGKGMQRDGGNPTVLYGYGGFAIPMTPRYSTARMAWLQAGGVYVVANLRGGSEYGSAWHKAGTQQRKQNVFDDCIAVAQALINTGYTSAEHLAVMGGSNGGLLVGAVINQRPELFKAALPQVGVMDMLRFHRFTAGRFWVDDYGSADDPNLFKSLYAYSPYHNLKPGQRYPATMVVTADTDDRVVPGHSFKYAARLQATADSSAPALLYVESNAGHGAGTPTEKLIRRYADIWAFLWDQLTESKH